MISQKQSVVLSKQPVFLSAVNKNNLKQIYVRSGKERITHKHIYTGSLLHQELHPVPRNP